MTINHPILETIEPSFYDKVLETVNNIKIHRSLQKDKIFSKKDYDEIQKVIDVSELTIVDLWKYSFDKENLEKKNEFHKICNECFNLLQVMPIPIEPIEKIKHVLKLFTYSYLGEKWEDMKRFLLENEEIWTIENPKNPDWNFKVLSNIYQAILHLIRKESWKDLSDTAKYITKLREDQKEFEKNFLSDVEEQHKKSTALELASYYHLAKAVDLLGSYMINGGATRDLTSRINYHFDTAIGYCQNARIFELDLLLRMLKTTFTKMIENSIWNITGQINSRATEFIKLATQDKKNKKPMYELLYPQRVAILEQRLLDPALKAIVVNLPTSSGKTIIAEFRIIQALNQFHEMGGKIAYVVPTRALVNQITSKLRRDLGRSPLNIKVEKMSGALDIDSFEENILESNSFDILVTTPEKLNLLIRHPEKREFAKKLVLTIIDEAHNISHGSRGLNLEMLIANIQKDCELSHLLLMTPFIPNHNEVAKWLDPFNPQSISMELDWWQPNDKVVGLYYANGKGNNLSTHFQPLVTYSPTMLLKNEIELGQSTSNQFSLTKVRSTRENLTVLVASQLQNTHNILILGSTVARTWSIAKKLSSTISDINDDPNLDLVSRYIAAELGESFPLAEYVKKGIGVHNSGLPDDIKELMEWLMEIGSLKILVSTTTISQGINFPINAILLTTYSYPRQGEMPTTDFWNLVGRAGRIDQHSLGFIGIAVDKKNSEIAVRAAKYVKKQTEELVSVLTKMVEDATHLGRKLNLHAYSSDPEWSSFLQYISHMYKQASNIQNFIAEVNINLDRTYGFSKLSQKNKNELIGAVKEYAERLDDRKELATLSDMTGFTPETIEKTISKVNQLNIEATDWSSSNLFSGNSRVLSNLTGIMLNDIPEIKQTLSDITIKDPKNINNSLSNIITDWVSGKDLSEIAQTYFGGTDTNSMSSCVRAIYGKVTNAATWGLSAIQKLPTSGISNDLSLEEQRQLTNLPSMIYYGVDSDEAILMRSNNIPRSISKKMGKIYKNVVPEYQKSTPSEVLTWIQTLDDQQWNSVVPTTRHLSGNEYKQIWQKISGNIS